jgi:hypothetical protein
VKRLITRSARRVHLLKKDAVLRPKRFNTTTLNVMREAEAEAGSHDRVVYAVECPMLLFLAAFWLL